jgi:hypothetical protein
VLRADGSSGGSAPATSTDISAAAPSKHNAAAIAHTRQGKCQSTIFWQERCQDDADNEDPRRAIARFFAAEKPDAVYCHGTSALVDVKLSDGTYLVLYD